MRRVLTVLGLLAIGCVQQREVGLTFGETGEGLDGFLCKDKQEKPLLNRLGTDAATKPASIVIDFVKLNGVPGCRASQLVAWCSTHDCAVVPDARACLTAELPTAADNPARDALRAQVREAMRTLKGSQVTPNAPDEFVMVRVIATAQPCDQLTGSEMPTYVPELLVGCAYSCPTLFDQVEQDVYLGFDTLTAACEQGVRICGGKDLRWQP